MTDQLTRIKELAQQLCDVKEALDAAEASAKDTKKTFLRLQREDLPSLMTEAGLTEIRLENGKLIRVQEDVDARITDATREAAIQWLDDNGFGGLVKTVLEVSYGRDQRDLAVDLYDELQSRSGHEACTLKATVHPATLKSFVKERLCAGESIPMDLFNVNPYNKATVK